MSMQTLISSTKVDTLVALSLWMDYDECLSMINKYESQELYEVCEGMMQALYLHSGSTLNCSIGNIYSRDYDESR
jgi:hypothetical protein